MNRIKQLRKEKKLSQLELAQKLGVAQSTLSTWETGRFEPDSKSLIALSEIFSVSVDYILGREKSFFQKTIDILKDNTGQSRMFLFSSNKENEDDADNGANLVKNVSICFLSYPNRNSSLSLHRWKASWTAKLLLPQSQLVPGNIRKKKSPPKPLPNSKKSLMKYERKG